MKKYKYVTRLYSGLSVYDTDLLPAKKTYHFKCRAIKNFHMEPVINIETYTSLHIFGRTHVGEERIYVVPIYPRHNFNTSYPNQRPMIADLTHIFFDFSSNVSQDIDQTINLKQVIDSMYCASQLLIIIDNGNKATPQTEITLELT